MTFSREPAPAGPTIPAGFKGRARPLSDGAYAAAAQRIGCEPAAVLAVAQVESRGHGFLPSGRPAVLFERHIFQRYSRGRFARTHPHLSNRTWGGYGAGGEAQHHRLAEALTLDRAAALQSASWGQFQIMGLHWEGLGYASPDAFVAAMCDGLDAQLDAFLRFIETNRLAEALHARDWATFARRYNGPAYARNRYDVKMAQAYAAAKVEAGEIEGRVDTIREAQRVLAQLDLDPGPIDGLVGEMTRAAALRFCERFDLPRDDARRPERLFGALQVARALVARAA
ncbi:MAG: N-acetylmuramidase family protein [Pseudomonadota bacterium]